MIHVFAVKDNKAGMFNMPFFQKSAVTALRAFAMEVNRNDAGNLLHNNPEDFDLYELGTFDEENGALLRLDKPQLVTTAEAVKKEK